MHRRVPAAGVGDQVAGDLFRRAADRLAIDRQAGHPHAGDALAALDGDDGGLGEDAQALRPDALGRSEEHTSELQSLMRISYAVFCLKKKTKTQIRETEL